MSSNITQMPISEEFLRAWPTNDGEKINHIALYPLLGFKVPTDEFMAMLIQTIRDIHKEYSPTHIDDCAQSVNFRINAALTKLDGEGKIIRSDLDMQNILPDDYAALHAGFGGNHMVQSGDGYTIFVPINLPLTPSAAYH